MAKAKKQEKKKSVSIAATDRTRAKIDLICTHHRRTFSQMIDIWADREMEALGLSLPPDWKPPVEEESPKATAKKPNKGKQ